MSKLPDESIDMILTDPPYLMNYKTNHRKNKDHKFCQTIQNDDNEKFLDNYLSLCYQKLKSNSAIYIFCNQNKIDIFKQLIEKNNFKIKNIIVWVKNNWTAGDLKAAYGKQYEFIILANKGRRYINGKRITDVWQFNRVAGNSLLHQNQKPIDLLEQCILKHSNENEIIFDGCMGSGSTGVACLNTNRKFIGFELDKEYFEIAKKRIEDRSKELKEDKEN